MVNNYLAYLDVAQQRRSFFPFDGGLSPPFHFALPGWQASQASQQLLLMPLTGGLLAPIYVFSPITPWQACRLADRRARQAVRRSWWSPLWLVLPASLHYTFHLFRFSWRALSFGCPWSKVLFNTWQQCCDNASIDLEKKSAREQREFFPIFDRGWGAFTWKMFPTDLFW